MNKINLLSVLAILFIFAACKSVTKDYAAYVDPFVGTGGHGHVYPGAVAPYPMIQPSPDTRITGWDACAGYHYSDTTINGFSQTHLSGTGCGDYGDILIMPMIGVPAILDRMDVASQQMPYASGFSHKNEKASPGYYSVVLDNYGIKAEITATQRAAIYRFTFPKSDSAVIILDMDYNLDAFGAQRNDSLSLQILSSTSIEGGKQTKGWAWQQAVNFYAETSQPFTCTLVKDTIDTPQGVKPRSKAILNFKTENNKPVMLKIALSGTDAAGAKKNLMAEIPSWDFNAVSNSTYREWNKELGRVKVETNDEEAKEIFYTSLYRASLCPNLFIDVDGRYMGMDRKIHQSNRPMYTVFSLWDTFRAYHPLMTIIDPERNADFVNTLVEKYKEGGLLPMWELASNYTGTMIGYNAVSVITDAYMKGVRNYDIEAAYAGVLKSSSGDTTGIIAP
ncbi:MAG: GH92 family glycosyl hydrolase, partial [Bacteroidales bacterium]